METFNLNIIPGKTCPVCHASQYDIGRTIRINLFENAAVYTLDGTETVSVSVRKTDGNVVTASVTNTSDSFVEIVTTEQMTACHGANLCELKIEKGADVIGTMNFILEVEQDPLEGGIASQSEIDNLANQVAAIVADQYDSNNVLFDAAPTPGHGIGYTVTSEGIGQAIDDAVDDLSDTLAPVATSGSYNDLTDTPSVPVIDDNTTSVSSIWSSDKTNTEIQKLIPNVTTITTISDTVVHSTDKDIYTVSLNKGVYIFNGSTLWKPSGTVQGLTMIAILGSDTLTQNLEYTVGWCVENLTAVFQVPNDNTNFIVRLYQSSGSNIAVDFSGTITRIMNG